MAREQRLGCGSGWAWQGSSAVGAVGGSQRQRATAATASNSSDSCDSSGGRATAATAGDSCDSSGGRTPSSSRACISGLATAAILGLRAAAIGQASAAGEAVAPQAVLGGRKTSRGFQAALQAALGQQENELRLSSSIASGAWAAGK
eukprot:350412-Chlamydomonas_euryale.AAC.1